MGRHAKGAARLRVSVSTVVLGTLIVTVIAVGSLFSSYAQPTPIAAEGIEGTAVVVSSLACDDGAGGTLIDVLSPAGLPVGTTVRANLDACGYQEGEQLRVRFAAGDPTRVWLLGNPGEDAVTGGRLLPYGLALAAVLAAGAAAAVWVDTRRGRRARVLATGRDTALVDTALLGTAPPATAPDRTAPDITMLGVVDTWQAPTRRPAGRHARPESDSGGTARPGLALPLLAWISPPAITADPDEFVEHQILVDRSPSSVDLSFPFTTSLADSLHDELFTHRTVRS